VYNISRCIQFAWLGIRGLERVRLRSPIGENNGEVMVTDRRF